MRNLKRNTILCALLIAALALTGCGMRSKPAKKDDLVNPAGQTVVDQTVPAVTSSAPASPSVTPQAVQTPVPVTTPAPGQATAGQSAGNGQTGAAQSGASGGTTANGQTSAQPTPPVQTARPAQTAAPVQTARPSQGASASGLPTVTKSPTGETVAPGGSCWFVAKYENAIYAEWHFVSPDGSRDLDYEQAGKEFTSLEILKGYASTMQLKNIPESLNGWSVYCRFSNKVGAVTTGRATITVKGSATSGLPQITKNPTGETVAPGGSCSFVARYQDAIWAEWHFVSPNGSRDLLYTQAGSEFPGLTISGGNTAVLKLSGIPAGLSGWSVYCRFTNNSGGVNTTRASITVTGGQSGGAPDGSAVIIPDGPGSGTVVPGGPGSEGPGAGTVVPGGPGSDGPGAGTVVPGGPGSDGPGAGTVVPGGPGSEGPGAGTVVPGGPGSDTPADPGVIIIG